VAGAKVWRDYDQAALDVQYNSRGTVADFSEDPAIMNQNRLFYEPVHFRAEAGRMVLEKLFAKEPKAP
jgi:hypothetical protein